MCRCMGRSGSRRLVNSRQKPFCTCFVVKFCIAHHAEKTFHIIRSAGSWVFRLLACTGTESLLPLLPSMLVITATSVSLENLLIGLHTMALYNDKSIVDQFSTCIDIVPIPTCTCTSCKTRNNIFDFVLVIIR